MFKLKKNWKYSEVFKILVLLGAIFILGSIVAVLSVFAYVSKDLPNPSQINARQITESTKIFDRTGDILLYDIHGEEQRTIIPAEQISNYTKWATVVIEDEDFYQHRGIDFKAILRAFWANLRGRTIAQGGSTITQQLIKNSILSSNRTYKRKIKEIILALQTERSFSKDQILSMYLNQIPYGSNAYGIEAASQIFFQKHSQDLSLAESALLAALPQAPTYYSPYGSHPEELKNKQIKILDKMAQLGYVSQEQADQAKQEKLQLSKSASIKAPHFVIFVKEYLAKKYGEVFLEQEGLKVITTLDMNLQNIAEETVANANLKQLSAKNAALISIDPKTGQILAMVGSRDYFDLANDGNVNVTTRPRQPGSSFKPFVYATAFKQGFSSETVIFDVETSFGKYGDKEYTPQNYSEKFSGPVTMRQALARSINVASVKVLYLAGVKKSIETARDLGITTLTDPNRYGLSLVLGGGEITLLEETAAYGVLANDGIRHETASILRIEDKNNKVLEEFKPEGKRVIDKEIVRLLTDVLSDNEARTPAFGANSPLYLGARPVAAKTGTTQEYRDAWLIGYTPSLTAGVWVGNNDNSQMKNTAAGSRAAGPIWHEFMTKALANTPIEEFAKPEVIPPNNFPREKIVKIDKISGKLATELTPIELVIEKKIKQAHSILYYIDQNDPQFINWESSVLRWAANNNYNETEPTEHDDIHTQENKPTVSITQTDINNQTITVQVLANAPLGIKQLDFFLDSQFIGTDRSEPFLISFFVAEKGQHMISVQAYDKASNSSEAKTEINIP
ncbi:MAG: PBP1A family penicillin-binding protein [bacterium]